MLTHHRAEVRRPASPTGHRVGVLAALDARRVWHAMHRRGSPAAAAARQLMRINLRDARRARTGRCA